MQKPVINEFALESFYQLEEEINMVISGYRGRAIKMRSANAKDKTICLQLFLRFAYRKMHNVQNHHLQVARFFGVSSETCLNLLRTSESKYKSDPEYKSMYDLIDLSGMKMNVEGKIKSVATQIRFIDKQIEVLKERRKLVLTGNVQ